jgi:hypothetical protein
MACSLSAPEVGEILWRMGRVYDCPTEKNIVTWPLEGVSRKRFMLKTLVLITLTLGMSAVQAGEAVLRFDTQLLSAPKVSAESVSWLNAGALVTTGSRQGLWIEVTEPMSGWLKLRQLKRNVAAVKSSSLSALQSGREGVGNTVSASGVRGLDAEMIKLGVPDHTAVEKFKASLVSSLDGQRFAATRSLLGKQIAYLADPEGQQKPAGREDSLKTSRANVAKTTKPIREKKVVTDDDW